MPRLIKVLSIDGGGIRGIIPAMVLAEIERRTRRPISQLFDLIAGTSTGGIVTLLLTKPNRRGRPQYSARDIVGLYEADGARIFPRSVWQRLHAMGKPIDARYPASGLESVLSRRLGSAKLKDALTDVLITSYEIERRIPWFFRSRRAKRRTDYDFLMRQVARAAAAAPTYFDPTQLPAGVGAEAYALIDGGVFANNPAMCALVEAKTAYRDADDVLLVSLGTGEPIRRFPYGAARAWGLPQWTQPILSMVFHGVSATVDYQVRQLLQPRRGIERYYRFQTKLNLAHDSMDDAGTANLRGLKLLAEELIRDRQRLLAALCRQLLR
jgi:predicted acylesterase/phospholipase RssA